MYCSADAVKLYIAVVMQCIGSHVLLYVATWIGRYVVG